MTDRPIIFSGPMVRALIEGRKTQTRRVLKPYLYDRALRPGMNGYKPTPLDLWQIDNDGPFFRVPYAPGDRLYVREAALFWTNTSDNSLSHVAAFKADGYQLEVGEKWRSPIHMPRWASRITLTVTDVRVQRLQDISEADAVAEGIVPVTRRFPPLQGCPNQLRERTIYEWSGGWSVRAADAYAALWNSLHGPDAWDANQWVCALTFTVEQRNIDAGGA